MKRFFFVTAFAALTLFPGPILAGTNQVGNMHVINPWARATPPGAGTGAAYMTLMNKSKRTDRLVNVSSPVAKKIEFHTHIKSGNIMRMRRVKTIPIKVGVMQTFKPGGFHIMLMGLKKSLKNGAKFPLTLTFEHAGMIKVNVMVHRIAGQLPGFLSNKSHKAHKAHKAKKPHMH